MMRYENTVLQQIERLSWLCVSECRAEAALFAIMLFQIYRSVLLGTRQLSPDASQSGSPAKDDKRARRDKSSGKYISLFNRKSTKSCVIFTCVDEVHVRSTFSVL